MDFGLGQKEANTVNIAMERITFKRLRHKEK